MWNFELDNFDMYTFTNCPAIRIISTKSLSTMSRTPVILHQFYFTFPKSALQI